MTTVDITPTPRILRTLGDIPFDVWQCIAELADNSLDALRDAAMGDNPITDSRVDIFWSNENVSASEREIVIQDNGPGMTLDTLQNAARAGYSSNDPINNLGLFGMGFNIATARLGEETRFMSATPDATEWVGISINFEELIQNKSFAAKIVTEPKIDPAESGTKIKVTKLRDGIFNDLKTKETAIRKRLEVIYSDVLQRNQVDIRVQNKTLRAHPHCFWSASRFRMYKNEKVHAYQEINVDLGPAWFDETRNRYLNAYEADELENSEEQKPGIVERSRRIKGWVGLQRYSDTTDFGIDFIRNGRKILIGDKSLFGYENPDTGTTIIEYPIELASTVGGRIVGEIHVDYLLPTYQKNGFDTSNNAWKITVDALRGAGPILPKNRQTLGYTGDNDSFIGRLVNAFRRNDPGTKCLALTKDVARRFHAEFRKNNPEYISDDKWFEALQEIDRARGQESDENLPMVDDGKSPSDDVSDYLNDPAIPFKPAQSEAASPAPNSNAETETSEKNELINRSDPQSNLTGKFSHDVRSKGFDVASWKLKSGRILKNGVEVPCVVFQEGVNIDFIYNDQHPIISEYPTTEKQLLLLVLAERLSSRDNALPLQEAYWGLVEGHLLEERISAPALRERAEAALGRIRDELPVTLINFTENAVPELKKSATETEHITAELLDKAPHLYKSFQDESGHTAPILAYVSEEGLLTLIQAFPEAFMDDIVFTLPYTQINTGAPEKDQRFRNISLEKIVSYLRDIKMLLRGASKMSKAELIRFSNTLRLFEDRLK